jgi:hypothetical protein
MFSLRSNEEAHVAHRNRAPLDVFAVPASLGESEANSDRLYGDQTDLLLLHFYGHSRFRRKLEDGCLLAFIQACEQHNVSIRKLQRIAVNSRLPLLISRKIAVLCSGLAWAAPLVSDPNLQSAYLTSLAKRHFRAGQNTEAVVAPVTEAKPRVPVPKSFVTKLSPIFANSSEISKGATAGAFVRSCATRVDPSTAAHCLCGLTGRRVISQSMVSSHIRHQEPKDRCTKQGH